MNGAESSVDTPVKLEQSENVTPNNSVVQESKNYAGFWIRFLAYCVDYFVINLIILCFVAILAVPFLIVFKEDSSIYVLGMIFAYVFIIGITIVYFIYFWAKSGQTLGMKLLAIKVQKENGQSLGFGSAIIRYIGFVISAIFFYIGLIWAGIDDKKQGWHDKMAGTYVIKTGEKSHKGAAILIVIVPFLLFFIVFPILLSIILIAINPAKQFGQANDTKRSSDVVQILNAIGAYQVNNNGNLPNAILLLTPDVSTPISEASIPGLCDELVPEYMLELPTDPSLNTQDIKEADCSQAVTGYDLTLGSNNTLTVSAPSTEVEEKDISITR